MQLIQALVFAFLLLDVLTDSFFVSADSGYKVSPAQGPAVTLSDPLSNHPSFTAPSGRSTVPPLVFELTVTTVDGLRARSVCVVNVISKGRAPVARAGSDQEVKKLQPVTLDGSRSSDPDGSIVSYRWTQMSCAPVTLSDPTDIKPRFMAPRAGSRQSALVFELMVRDSQGLMSRDTCTVKVDTGWLQ